MDRRYFLAKNCEDVFDRMFPENPKGTIDPPKPSLRPGPIRTSLIFLIPFLGITGWVDRAFALSLVNPVTGASHMGPFIAVAVLALSLFWGSRLLLRRFLDGNDPYGWVSLDSF